jgi:small subunit ribosomal protein S24
MESTIEDLFIRKFIMGTWCTLFLSEIIIKRNHNIIRIAGIVKKSYDPIKYYFLVGYTEEILSYYMHCTIKLELQSAMNEDVIFKFI